MADILLGSLITMKIIAVTCRKYTVTLVASVPRQLKVNYKMFNEVIVY